MGVIAAVLGMGLAAADGRGVGCGRVLAPHHVLVKSALFLTIGVAAAASPRRLFGVVFFGGGAGTRSWRPALDRSALAKLAIKAPLGNGTAATLAAAAGTTSHAAFSCFALRGWLRKKDDWRLLPASSCRGSPSPPPPFSFPG